ncbi:MAG TPA: DUF3857 domain-containing protein, partial [Phaeodactylibacter sp.]|nr:DUF3857 domain-containing protein [Phaeodactylibacter sp.]
DGGRRTTDGGRRTADDRRRTTNEYFGDSQFLFHEISSAVCRPPSAVCRPPSAVRRPPSAVRRPPSAVQKKTFMKKILFLIFANTMFFSSFLFSKKPIERPVKGEYAVSNIPEALLKNSNAVVRMDDILFNLSSPRKAVMTRKYAITILNRNADDHAHFQEYYDGFRKITSIKGVIYDKNGKQVRKIKKKEIIDVSIATGFYEDARLKAVEVTHNTYPFTIEFEYKTKYSSLLIYPAWIPVRGYEISVQESSYKALIPEDMDFRYKTKNLSVEPKIGKEEDKKSYKWVMENFAAIKKEPYSPSGRNMFPQLLLSPNEFEYAGYKGNMKTWKSYGKWLYDLAGGREELDEETVAKIKQMVANAKDDEEKIKIIYEYLQSKTRYISIQLGIGGLQPFEAKTVNKTGYGDCKALSNYTRAMLKAAGIKSYHATIGAGRGNTSIEPDFPFKGYTNHMILCVPLESDTVWLECTSQNQPYGFLGSFTDDRNALLITEEGGKIVRTTRYTQEDNTQIRKATVKIDRDGNAHAKVVTKYKGLQYENVQHQFVSNKKEQKEELFQSLDIPNMEIRDFKYTQVKDRIPEATEELDLEIKNYASVSGKRIFIPFNILNKRKSTPKKIKNRKTDIVVKMAYTDVDEIVYEIPSFLKIEHIPESVSFDSDFGSYAATVTQDKNIITYTRTLKINKNTYPPERYKDFIAFYKKIVRADKMKMVTLEVERP